MYNKIKICSKGFSNFQIEINNAAKLLKFAILYSKLFPVSSHKIFCEISFPHPRCHSTFGGKFIHRYLQRNAVPGYAGFSYQYRIYCTMDWNDGRNCRGSCGLIKRIFRKMVRCFGKAIAVCDYWIFIQFDFQTTHRAVHLRARDIFPAQHRPVGERNPHGCTRCHAYA